MRFGRASLSFVIVLASSALRAQVAVLTVQQSGTASLLQAVSVSATVPGTAWISGHKGTYAVTTDGGTTWTARTVAGRETLEFRDVHAIDAKRAWLMAAGDGDKSGIFRTTDGGATWHADFLNREPAAFYDCMAFWDDTHGFAFSDVVLGDTPLMLTTDGITWTRSRIPGAQSGEGGFAASGTCAITLPNGDAVIGTGSGAVPRVLRSSDRGRSWQASILPLAAGTGAGATSVAFRDLQHGMALGGVIGGPAVGPRVARTENGGRSWSVATDPPFTGAVYGAAYASTPAGPVLVAVGPGGAASTRDDGRTWTVIDAEPYWSVGFGPDGAGWMVGPKGRVVRITWR